METEINFLFSNEHRTIPSFKAAATMQQCESLKQGCCLKYLSSSLVEEKTLMTSKIENKCAVHQLVIASKTESHIFLPAE